MKIQNLILKHQKIFLEFSEWYKGDMPFNIFIDADFKYQYCYLIMFLADKNVMTATSRKAYVIYNADTLKVVKSEEYEQPKECLEACLINTIDKAFEYLTNPF